MHKQLLIQSINHWKAIFETDVNDIESVQPSLITYTKTNAESVMELRSTLEREIRLKFDESRPYGIPHWNVLISRLVVLVCFVRFNYFYSY